jgi:hypothetical protein
MRRRRLAGNMTVDRKEMAKVFRLKSNESYGLAQECLELQRYRGACNRSWYAVMQIITAAAYEELADVPPNSRPTWTHERQSSLFRSLTNKHNVWEKHKALATEIDMTRERRNDADYFAPNELHGNLQGASKSLETAGKVREVILNLLAKKWDVHLPDDNRGGE